MWMFGGSSNYAEREDRSFSARHSQQWRRLKVSLNASEPESRNLGSANAIRGCSPQFAAATAHASATAGEPRARRWILRSRPGIGPSVRSGESRIDALRFRSDRRRRYSHGKQLITHETEVGF